MVNARAAELGLRVDEFSPDHSGRAGAARPDENGFASIRSVRLTPMSDTARPTAHAEVETEHYAVDPAPRPAAPAAGGGHP